MKLAITIWDNRISPVFDTAKRFLLVELGEDCFHRGEIVAVEKDPFTTLFFLQQEQGVELLLCGALCRRGEKRIETAGLDVQPFLSGEVDAILQDLVAGGNLENYALPGCRRHCCCRRREKKGVFFGKGSETGLGGGSDESERSQWQ